MPPHGQKVTGSNPVLPNVVLLPQPTLATHRHFGARPGPPQTAMGSGDCVHNSRLSTPTPSTPGGRRKPPSVFKLRLGGIIRPSGRLGTVTLGENMMRLAIQE